MTRKMLSLSLGLALMATTAAPVLAADWHSGAAGMKDYGVGHAGVPVPAPVPIPDYEPQWYLRGDIGYNFNSSGNVDSVFEPNTIGPSSFDTERTGSAVSTIGFEDLEGQGVISFGVGAYLTDAWRFDVTGEKRLAQRIVENPTSFVGRIRNNEAATNGGNVTVGAFTAPEIYRDFFYDVNRSEQTDLSSYMLMANMYYDLDARYGFKPYVGAGVGFVFHHINRDYTESATCFRQTQYTETIGSLTSNTCNGAGAVADLAGGDDTTGVGLGLSLMAGVGYEMRDGLHWDLGYRYVYSGGSVAIATPTFNGLSTVEVEGRHDHEIRTGIRFDIQ
ncbi:MAG: opacity family porin [Pseudomonadota bacterium]